MITTPFPKEGAQDNPRQLVGAYIITCKKTEHRVPKLLENLEGCTVKTNIVKKFDTDRLPDHLYEPLDWQNNYLNIEHIIHANLIALGYSQKKICDIIMK